MVERLERGGTWRLGAGRQAGSKQQQRSAQDGLASRPVPRRRRQVCAGEQWATSVNAVPFSVCVLKTKCIFKVFSILAVFRMPFC